MVTQLYITFLLRLPWSFLNGLGYMWRMDLMVAIRNVLPTFIACSIQLAHIQLSRRVRLFFLLSQWSYIQESPLFKLTPPFYSLSLSLSRHLICWLTTNITVLLSMAPFQVYFTLVKCMNVRFPNFNNTSSWYAQRGSMRRPQLLWSYGASIYYGQPGFSRSRVITCHISGQRDNTRMTFVTSGRAARGFRIPDFASPSNTLEAIDFPLYTDTGDP